MSSWECAGCCQSHKTEVATCPNCDLGPEVTDFGDATFLSHDSNTLNSRAAAGFPTYRDGIRVMSNSLGIDTVPGSATTTESIGIGQTVTGGIDFSGDEDWYQITLQAGQSYLFTLTGTGGVPLADPFLRIRDSFRTFALDDDGGPGLNSAIRFTALETGVYYLSAAAFADETGEFTLTAQTGPAQNPLDALNLGFRLEGNEVRYYFATAGQTFQDSTADRAFFGFERTAVISALQSYAPFINVTFRQVTNSEDSNLQFVLSSQDPDLLGFAVANAQGGTITLYPGGEGWTTSGLRPGGYGYTTILHEIGHALGLAHPHDNGGLGDANSEVLQGVVDEFNDAGPWGLNQGAFTVLSYNDGWPQGPRGRNPALDSGYNLTAGALDIALLQQLYGANPTTNTGDTIYVVGEVDASRAIYDAGGNDWLVAAQASGFSFTLDLRSATLRSEVGGGGFPSFNDSSYAPITIAAGTVIENARGGSRADMILGNDTANRLEAGEGSGGDQIFGHGGNDYIVAGRYGLFDGGGGSDTLDLSSTGAPFGYQIDLLITTSQGDSFDPVTVLDIEHVAGSSFADQLSGTLENNFIDGRAGKDSLLGRAGSDTLIGGDAWSLSLGQSQIFRMYQATLGRAPDAPGLIFWSGQLASGAGLDSIAGGFVNSAEFQARFGSPDNAGFVTLLYNNVLGRAPDQGGFDFWLGELSAGRSVTSVVLGFSESPEFIQSTQFASAAFATTTLYGPGEGQIFRIYQTTLGRAPDDSGFLFWTGELAKGASLADIVSGFTGSAEFLSRFGAPDNAGFVQLLYNNVLGRDPDQGGFDFYVSELAQGRARNSVVLEFSESVENQARTAESLENFLGAGSLADLLEGGAGDDILFGGRGADTFVFRASEAGSDQVIGLETYDTLQLLGFDFSSPAAFLALLTQQGDDVVFQAGDVTITFLDTQLAALENTDLLFA